jgi:PAS domain S-box-containing protein
VSASPVPAEPSELLLPLIDGASAIISVKDRQGRHLLVNEAFAALAGLPRERIVGRRVDEVHPPSIAQILHEQDESVWATDQRLHYELTLPLDGRMRHVLFEKYLLRDGSDQPLALCAVGMDVTDLRNAQALASEKARLLQMAFDAILTWRIGGGIERWNRGAELMYGYTEKEAFGRSPHDLLRTEFSLPLETIEVQLMDTGTWNGELLHCTKDGRRIVVDSRMQLYRGPDGSDRVLEINRDVTAAKASQRALEERERELRRVQIRLEAALAAGGMGVWELDPTSDDAIWYGPTYALLGLWPSERAVNKGADFRRFIHPDDRPRVEAALQRAARDGEEFVSDYRIVLPDGQVRWLGTRGRYLPPEPDASARFIGVNFDITERKSVEQALRETDQRRNEFLAMLAHELRNPLAPITNAVTLLERCQDRPELLGKATQIIQRQARHLARLVDDLLEVSRVTRGRIELRKEEVQLDAVIAAAVETVRPMMQDQHQTLKQQVEPGLELDADPARLLQVVANLLNNASKYTPEGGHVEVVARAVDEQLIEIVVSDNGIGLEPDLLPRVFDLFTQGASTLDRSRGGLGIGLSLVKSLVELHGGTVRASSPGKNLGATFTLRLPRRERRVAPRAGDLPGYRPIPPTTLLVADDNHDAADSLALLLRADGHTVLLAYDGPSALALAREHRPAVALLDLGMPGISGYDVGAAMRADPALRDTIVIALSGYGQMADRERSAAVGFDAHLLKPADLAGVYEAVAQSRARTQ